MPQKEQVHPSRTDASDRKLAEDARRSAERSRRITDTTLQMELGRKVGSPDILQPRSTSAAKPSAELRKWEQGERDPRYLKAKVTAAGMGIPDPDKQPLTKDIHLPYEKPMSKKATATRSLSKR